MWLEHPKVKTVAVVAFAFFAGMAVMNGYETRNALDGSARWWQRKCAVDATVAREVQKAKDGIYDVDQSHPAARLQSGRPR